MQTIHFVNVNFKGNVGDYWSSPLKFYDWSNYNVIQHDFVSLAHNGNRIKDSIVIIGGGGLLMGDNEFFQKPIFDLVENNKVIFWGVGHQTKGDKWDEKSQKILDVLNHPNVLLKGTRDIFYQHGLNDSYLPCVSCKHEIFDKKENQYGGEGIGIYEKEDEKITTFTEFEKISNSSDIVKVISFFKTKDIIITNSYHGIYWSQLLHKKVLFNGPKKCNSKFIGLKHRVFNCDESNYKEKIKNNSGVVGFLEESRYLNDKFYGKVIKIIN